MKKLDKNVPKDLFGMTNSSTLTERAKEKE